MIKYKNHIKPVVTVGGSEKWKSGPTNFATHQLPTENHMIDNRSLWLRQYGLLPGLQEKYVAGHFQQFSTSLHREA